MTVQAPRFTPTEDGGFKAEIGGFNCLVSPLEDDDCWTVTVEGITIVKATDELEHAIRSCVTFANGIAGDMS